MFEQGVSTVLGVIINDAYVYGSMIYFSSFATAATFAVVLFLIYSSFLGGPCSWRRQVKSSNPGVRIVQNIDLSLALLSVRSRAFFRVL